MSIFAAGDILQFAIGMEENGALFYRQAADLSQNSDVKKLFQRLASEEEEHQKTFDKFFSQVNTYEPVEEYPGEYLDYLHNYINGKASSVFFAEDTSELKSIDVSHALDFAMKREMASILYFTELKDFVGKSDQKAIDAIIEEERKHVAQLSELKKLF
jgi:rubrerythrin